MRLTAKFILINQRLTAKFNHSHYIDNLNAKAKPETATYSVTGTTVKIKGYGSWKISDDKRSMTEISSGVKMVKK